MSSVRDVQLRDQRGPAPDITGDCGTCAKASGVLDCGVLPRAYPIFHDDRLPHGIGHFLADHAGHEIDDTAGRKRHQHPDLLRWIALPMAAPLSVSNTGSTKADRTSTLVFMIVSPCPSFTDNFPTKSSVALDPDFVGDLRPLPHFVADRIAQLFGC